jgi:hypothetical protein
MSPKKAKHASPATRPELPDGVAFLFEGLFFQLACVAIQHRDRLLSSVQIATYNSHLGLLRSELC